MRTHPSHGGSAAWLFLPITALLFACAADDEDDGPDDAANEDGPDEESGAEAPAESLEIEGEWTDDFMGAHSITTDTWTQTFGADSFAYAIAAFDNTADTLVAEADDATWSKFQWTAAAGGGVYYCQVAFGEATQADAAAAPLADTADPAMGGCGMFPWTLLMPAM
jgi:hypothetical protein